MQSNWDWTQGTNGLPDKMCRFKLKLKIEDVIKVMRNLKNSSATGYASMWGPPMMFWLEDICPIHNFSMGLFYSKEAYLNQRHNPAIKRNIPVHKTKQLSNKSKNSWQILHAVSEKLTLEMLHVNEVPITYYYVPKNSGQPGCLNI